MDLKTAVGHRHPAVLIAVIVNRTFLPDIPTNRNQFKERRLQNQIACVMFGADEKIRSQTGRFNDISPQVIEDIAVDKVNFGNGGKTLCKISDGYHDGI